MKINRLFYLVAIFVATTGCTQSAVDLDAERAALRLALHGAMAPSQATPEHFDELFKYFDEDQAVEIVASIALFGFLNRWNDTMATDLEALPSEVAAETIGGKFGWEPGKHS